MSVTARQLAPQSLNDRLAALHAERVRSWDGPALQRNIDQRAELVAAADPANWAKAGDQLDEAELVDVEAGPQSLLALAAKAPTVLVFFRYAGCPACNIALPYYNETLAPELDARGVALIAVSPQLPDRLIEIKRRHGLEFAVASDPGNRLARALGISFEANAASQAHSAVALGEVTGTGTWELPKPAVLLIDRQSIVRFVDVSPDWLMRTATATILAAVDALLD